MGPMLKPSDGGVLYFYGWAGPPATVVVAYAVSTVGSASNNNRVLALWRSSYVVVVVQMRVACSRS